MKKTLSLLAIFPFLMGFWGITHADVTQSDVTSSRSNTTTYTNTTGYPMFVGVSSLSGVTGTDIIAFVDATGSPTNLVCRTSSLGNSAYDSCFIVVPKGWNYYFNINGAGASIYKWIEWSMASTTGGGGSSSSGTNNYYSSSTPDAIIQTGIWSTFTNWFIFISTICVSLWIFKLLM
jgi:hypothetical protein